MTREPASDPMAWPPGEVVSAREDEAGPVLHWSASGSGTTGLVLVHELGGTLHSFDALVLLLEADFRVLRFDQRGAGGSEKVRHAFTITDLAHDLLRVLSAARLPTPCWVLGAAAGAAVALAFAARNPRLVAGLVLCGPALRVDADRRVYLEARAALALRDGMCSVVDATLARSYPPECRSHTEVFEQYRSRLLACDPVGYALANRALAAMCAQSPLSETDVPCLLLAGQHDLLRPLSAIHALARELRNARCIDIDSGHLMAVQTPELVATEVRRFVFATPAAGPQGVGP